jgi:hypothetical protein
MKIDITIIPHEVQVAAGKIAAMSMQVETLLKSNTAMEASALLAQFYPAAGAMQPELVALCEAAIKTCQAIQHEDWSGVTARLQRLVADSTHVLTGNAHGISKCIIWCETIIRDLLDTKS